MASRADTRAAHDGSPPRAAPRRSVLAKPRGNEHDSRPGINHVTGFHESNLTSSAADLRHAGLRFIEELRTPVGCRLHEC